MEEKPLPESARINYLDGLRGIASVGVFLWHNFLAFFPGAVDPSLPLRAAWLERWIYCSPLAVFFAGDFNVYIFFVLSGFVISISFFRNKNADKVKKSYLRRYVRLMPPAAATVFVAYFLLANHLMFNNQAGAIANSWWLHLNWSAVNVSFLNAAWTAFYGIWFVGLSPQAHFNSNLGTLFIEILGSYMIFSYLTVAFTMQWEFRARMAASSAMVLFALLLEPGEPHFAIFFVGMIIADIFVSRPHYISKLGKLSYLWLVAGVIFGSANIGNIPAGPYHVFSVVFGFLHLHPLTYPWAMGAIFMILAALTLPWLQRLFQTRPFQIMGDYSFSLYVAHTVVIGSFTSWAFVELSHWGYFDYTGNVLVAFLAALPVLAVFVYVLRKIDDASVTLSRRL